MPELLPTGDALAVSVTAEKAREMLAISKTAFYRFIKSEELETYKVGRRRFVLVRVVQAFGEKLNAARETEIDGAA